jgi:DNA-binding response OmpR family regulator
MESEMKEINLLLVDDEEEFRTATSQALKRRGFRVSQAKNGEAAIGMITSGAFDIVVLDLRMPKKDGIETLVEIRSSNKTLPVIILTGHGALDDAMAGIQLGIVDFIQKPVDIDVLSARIRALLAEQRKKPLREKTLWELMENPAQFQRVYSDQCLGEVLPIMVASIATSTVGENTEQGRRVVLVFNRADQFQGCLEIGNLLSAVLPEALKDSPYASYLTGMFVAQCKLIRQRTASDYMEENHTVEVDASLMEALHIMVETRRSYLPVVQNGALVGVLRESDLLAEVLEMVNSGMG